MRPTDQHWCFRLNDFLDHVGATRTTVLICTECGKMEGAHTFDTSCSPHLIRVWSDTVTLNEYTGRVRSASSVTSEPFVGMAK